VDVVEFTLVFSFLWSVLCLIETILQTQFLSVYSDESNWQMFSTLTLPAHMWINFSIKHVIIGNCYGLVYNLFSVIILNDCLSRVIFLFLPWYANITVQYSLFPFQLNSTLLSNETLIFSAAIECFVCHRDIIIVVNLQLVLHVVWKVILSQFHYWSWPLC